MRIYIINQDTILVDDETGKKIIEALKSGAEYITINGEYVKASVITGVRNDEPERYYQSMLPGQVVRQIEAKKEKFTSEGINKFKDARKRFGL